MPMMNARSRSYERQEVATSGTTLFRSIGGSVGAAAFGGISPAFQMPCDVTSLEELSRIVTSITARETRWRAYQRSAERMGIKLEPARMGENYGRGPFHAADQGVTATGSVCVGCPEICPNANGALDAPVASAVWLSR